MLVVDLQRTLLVQIQISLKKLQGLVALMFAGILWEFD
jgi:hypothetical protein